MSEARSEVETVISPRQMHQIGRMIFAFIWRNFVYDETSALIGFATALIAVRRQNPSMP